MTYRKSLPVLFAAVCLAAPVHDGSAQVRGAGGQSGTAVGRAVPRVAGGYRLSPRVIGFAPYRPYFYPYRPGITFGFYGGFGYPYGYPYYYGYPYGYPAYGYGYPPPPGYMGVGAGYAYGGVRIQGAPRQAQVFADGYYVGIVDDFDGTFQHLNLQAGVHKIEIKPPAGSPVTFDVNVPPGQTVTYHAGLTR
jgi:hypothetical protein